jgi:hypothetical protein
MQAVDNGLGFIQLIVLPLRGKFHYFVILPNYNFTKVAKKKPVHQPVKKSEY